MAYMNQELKATLAAKIKAVMPAGWKTTLAVNNHSTLVLYIMQAPVDIIGNVRETIEKIGSTQVINETTTNFDVNVYHLDRQFSGPLLATMQAINAAMNEGNYDKSDIMTDYFNVGWYTSIKIGRWDMPFLETVPMPPKAAKVKRLNPATA